MIILDATTKTLEMVLAGAVATTQPDFVSTYVDLTTTSFTSKEQDGVGNSTTNVTIVSAPAASTQRQVKFVSITNKDTAAITVTVNYNNNGTRRRVYKASLAVGYTLTYTDGDGWRVWTTTGALLTSPDPSGQPPVYFAETTIGNTAIKALPTTYQTFVPQPASGFILMVDWAILRVLVPSGAYTGVDAGNQQGLSIAYGDWDLDCCNFYPWTGIAFAAQLRPFHSVANDGAGVGSNFYPDDAVELAGDKPLKIIGWNALDYTGGGVNNTLYAAVLYRLFDYNNNRFV